ncbi:single-stranded DNA-binding protein [Acidovorax sp. LjRoot129]|uniref:single-stranded DNA-binding protein n=1 Tax=unclassified Acidovorax TaxID=2684926 RepID=UPI003ED04D95
MLFVNEMRVLGYLGSEPEIRTFPSGDRIATLSIGTTDKWRDRQTTELREHTEWHRVVVREKGSVEYLEKYAEKGSPCYVEGAMRTRKVPASSPGTQDRIFTEVHATKVTVFPKLGDSSRTKDSGSEKPAAPAPAPDLAAQRRPSPSRQAPAASANTQRHAHVTQSNTQGSNRGYPESQFDNDDALNGAPLRF